MFPGLSSQLKVDGTSEAAVYVASCVDPCVYDKTRARFQMEGLIRPETSIQIVEEGSGRDLGRRVARA